ncbi:SBBP repeat-containing protein [Candidatus Latescibacterota bacterium]
MLNRFLASLLIFCSLSTTVSAETTYVLDESYGNVPVTFILNEGQFQADLWFSAEGNGDGVYTNGNYPLTIYNLTFDSKNPAEKVSKPAQDNYVSIRLNFFGTNSTPEITGENPVSWCSNFFIGNDPEQWVTDVPNYEAIRFHNLYEGIDLVYSSEGRRITYELMIHPGADPSQLAFQKEFREYTTLSINEKGELVCFIGEIDTYGTTVQAAPEAYQQIDGKIIPVTLRYRFIDEENRIVTFDYSEYDTNHTLIIKPPMVLFRQFGIKVTTEVNAIDVDQEGCTYVAGEGGHGNTLFALKLNEAGDKLEYVTYFGVSGNAHNVSAIDVSNDSELVIVGSARGDFPTTNGAFDTINDEIGKSYVLKLNDKGNKLLFSTFIGGTDYFGNTIGGIDVSNEGNVFIAGWTQQRDFPTTPGVLNPEYVLIKHPELDSYNRNGFITKFNLEGSDLEFSTFFDTAELKAIKVDDSGEILVAGNDAEIFVAKLNTNASDSLFTLRFGGNDSDELTGMDIDNKGNIYVVGYTESEDFFTTDGSVYQGERDIFLSKITSTGEILYSVLLGGTDDDGAYGGICVDKNGNAYITGATSSIDYPITPGAYHEEKYGGNDVILTIIDSLGKELLYSTYIGNSGADGANGIKVDTKSDIYLFGHSEGITQEPTGLFNEGEQFLIKFKLYDSTVITKNSNQLNEFKIFQPYPNPFNPSVTLSYQLFRDSEVTLDIYNIHGQKISTVVNDFQEKGLHNIQWDGNNYPSGVYFYRMRAGNEMKNGKLMLIK